MSAITTHVLDTASGRPAAGILVVLERAAAGTFQELGRGTTDTDGRLRSLLAPDAHIAAGGYRLTFHVAAYFAGESVESFYTDVSIQFTVKDPTQHYHVPLLLSPFGYSTYRGS